MINIYEYITSLINLLKEKFDLKKISVVDMFCQTTGAECVSLLELK